MKFLKKYGFVLLIASFTGAFSTAALANNNGDQIAYDAFDLIINKVKNASATINTGKCIKVASLIKSALDACKEVDASDLVDRDRMKACSILMSAKKHAKECDLVNARNKLTQAENMFEAIKIRDLNLQQIK